MSPTAFECFTDIHAGEIFVYNYELKALLSVLKTCLQHTCFRGHLTLSDSTPTSSPCLTCLRRIRASAYI